VAPHPKWRAVPRQQCLEDAVAGEQAMVERRDARLGGVDQRPVEPHVFHRAAASGGCADETIGALSLELRSSALLRCSLTARA